MALRTGDCSFDWAVSDDGARVAYVNAQEGMEDDVTLVTVATGKEETIFRGDFPEDLAFSRDGAALLLISGGRTAPKLYEINLGTRRAKALPNSGYQLMAHPFSLQDGRVAFAASLSFGMMERDPSLFTMPAGGGAWMRLGTLSAPVSYMSGTLSPDGKKIAVQRSVHQGKFSANWHTDVSVMALDGRYGKPLARSFPQPFHALIDPSWGPDSRHLAAVLVLCPRFRCEFSIRSVVLIDTSAKKPKLVFLGHDSHPAFRPVAGESTD